MIDVDTDRQKGDRYDGWMDGWIDRQIDRCANIARRLQIEVAICQHVP